MKTKFIVRIVLMLVVLNIFSICFLQAQKRCSCCYDSAKAKRTDIIGEKLKNVPYTSIVNLYVNSEKFRGTASFIASNILITAKHNLYEGKKPKTLFLHINSSLDNKVIILRKKDYRIFHKEGDQRENDIALIKVTNSERIKDLSVSNFTLMNYENIKSLLNDTIHIAGYSCDKGLQNPNARVVGDTLTDKYITPLDSIIFNADRSIMTFYTCACRGDSGAPLWVSAGNNYYIIGVYKGLSNFIDSRKIMNIAVVLNKEKVDWINSVLNE
ncbi:MAG: trypsin-like serine protease [Chitinophagaceae bacterium]|nr:trypsin-like serine protease [Chitinophagaceae bacterium]